MLITFKSAAAADVLMFGDHGKAILRILGKDGDDSQGIVTVEQLGEAIASLRAAIAADKASRSHPSPAEEEAAREAGQTGIAAPVSLAQRAYPLLAMLEDSLRERSPVTWGV